MNLAPVPFRNAVVDANQTLTDRWREWFVALVDRVNHSPDRVGTVALTGQTASIAAVAIPASVLTTALYRLSYAFRVTTVAGVSSSLALTIAWTSGGVAQTQAYAAEAGNTTTTRQTGVLLLVADAGTSVTYATTYASNPAAAMVYQLDVRLEAV